MNTAKSESRKCLTNAGFARDIGVTDVITHVGFIPENPNDPEFESIVLTLRHICKTIGEFGQYFLFETGQETPTTLLRTIEEIGTGNLGVNLDTANLILYGRGNPVDALDVIGKYVRNTHMKDGFYPVSGRSLGKEVPLGEGKVNVREFIKSWRASDTMAATALSGNLRRAAEPMILSPPAIL